MADKGLSARIARIEKALARQAQRGQRYAPIPLVMVGEDGSTWRAPDDGIEPAPIYLFTSLRMVDYRKGLPPLEQPEEPEKGEQVTQSRPNRDQKTR